VEKSPFYATITTEKHNYRNKEHNQTTLQAIFKATSTIEPSHMDMAYNIRAIYKIQRSAEYAI
jgi:hypothetical protein